MSTDIQLKLIKKLSVIENISEGPIYKSDLARKSEYSKSTVYRDIKKFNEMDIVTQEGNGCILSNRGRVLFRIADSFWELTDVLYDYNGEDLKKAALEELICLAILSKHERVRDKESLYYVVDFIQSNDECKFYAPTNELNVIGEIVHNDLLEHISEIFITEDNKQTAQELLRSFENNPSISSIDKINSEDWPFNFIISGNNAIVFINDKDDNLQFIIRPSSPTVINILFKKLRK